MVKEINEAYCPKIMPASEACNGDAHVVLTSFKSLSLSPASLSQIYEFMRILQNAGKTCYKSEKLKKRAYF